jgi:hypothetical protein
MVKPFSTQFTTPLAGNAHNMNACAVSRMLVDLCARHNSSEFSTSPDHCRTKDLMKVSKMSRLTDLTVKFYTRARGVPSRHIHNSPMGYTQQCDGCNALAEGCMCESMGEMTHGILAQQAGTP